MDLHEKISSYLNKSPNLTAWEILNQGIAY